jgi:uncharacterized protein
MRKKGCVFSKAGLIFCLMVSLILGGAFSNEAQAAGTLRIAATALGSSYYNYANAMAQQMRKVLPDYTVDILPFAGSLGNIKLLQEKKTELGLTSECLLAWAYNGEANFKGKPDKNIRQIVGNMDKYYMAFIAKKGFKAKSVDEMIDKKMPIKYCTLPEGGVAVVALRHVFEMKGVSEADLKSWGGSIKFGNHNALAEMIKTGQADVWVHPIVVGHPAITEFTLQEDVVFLPLENDTAEKMNKKLNYQNVIMPKGIFRGAEATRSVAFATVLAVMADLDEDVVYKSTKAIFENRKQMGALDAGLKDFDMTKDNLGQVAPFHKGAEKYFKEIGLVK